MRFHGNLDDQVGVYDATSRRKSVYTSAMVDQIYDGLLANGSGLSIEISFMPSCSRHPTPHAFLVHPTRRPLKTRWNGSVSSGLHTASGRLPKWLADEVENGTSKSGGRTNIDFCER